MVTVTCINKILTNSMYSDVCKKNSYRGHMINKKILMLLSLTVTFNLNCATSGSGTVDETVNDLLGVEQGEKFSKVQTQKEDFGEKGSGLKYQHWHHRGGLDNSTPEEMEWVSKRMDVKCQRYNNRMHKKPSWSESFNSLLQWVYSFIYSQETDKKTDQKPGTTEVTSQPKDEGDTLGVTAGAGVATNTGPTAKFTNTNGIDLFSGMTFDSSMVYNQRDINCCTTNVLAFIIRYWSVVNSASPTNFTPKNPSLLNPSRLFMYRNAKWIANKLGATDSDLAQAKAITLSAEQSLIALDQYGACPENQLTTPISISVSGDAIALPLAQDFSKNTYAFPGHFDFDDSNLTVQPGLGTYYASGNAINIAGTTIKGSGPYASISSKITYKLLGTRDSNNIFTPDTALFKSELTTGSNKRPIFIGLRLYSPFLDNAIYNSNKPFFVPMPNASGTSQTYQGGHAVTIVGWGNYNPDLPKQNYFKVLNSWGSGWGDCGFCYLPEEYITAQYNVFTDTKDSRYGQLVPSGTVNTSRIDSATNTTVWLYSKLANTVSAYSVTLAK